MGNPISKVQNEIKQAEAQADSDMKQMEADIQNLMAVLNARADEYYVKLVNSKAEDKSVPIKTVVEYKKHVSCQVSSEPSGELTAVIEELFGGNFLGSLKALCLAASEMKPRGMLTSWNLMLDRCTRCWSRIGRMGSPLEGWEFSVSRGASAPSCRVLQLNCCPC